MDANTTAAFEAQRQELQEEIFKEQLEQVRYQNPNGRDHSKPLSFYKTPYFLREYIPGSGLLPGCHLNRNEAYTTYNGYYPDGPVPSMSRKWHGTKPYPPQCYLWSC